jgi:hypothetical protein
MTDRTGELAMITRNHYTISLNGPTWKFLTRRDYTEPILHDGYYLEVQQMVKRRSKDGKSPPKYEWVRHAPRLVDNGEGDLVLARPGLFTQEARLTAQELKLSNKDQNHGVLRTKEYLTNGLLLQKLYRNDVPGIVRFVGWWQEFFDWLDLHAAEFEMKYGEPYVGQDKHPRLYTMPPRFWVGSNGGGAILASEKGCPGLDSISANRNAPDGYVSGGRLDTSENRALDNLYYRTGVFTVDINLDPLDHFEKTILREPDESMKKGAGLYLGFLYFQDREDGIDDIDDIILELEDLKLPYKDKKYATFRTMRHTKYWASSVLTPLDFVCPRKRPWTALRIPGTDSGSIAVTREGRVPDDEGPSSGGKVFIPAA